MRRRTPPLGCIEAFVAATRQDNFREAAEEFALSASAFTRRIQVLESFVGAPLFDRTASGVKLNARGEQYLAEVSPALERIRKATLMMRAVEEPSALRVIVPQSFAMAWLVPHLPHWSDSNQFSQIRLKTGHSRRQLKNDEADIGIFVEPLRASDGEMLAELDAQVVMPAQGLSNDLGTPGCLEDLPHYPVLSVYKPEGIWESWLNNLNYIGDDLEPVAHFESIYLQYEAAAAGFGLALGVRLLADSFIRSGRLVPCLPDRASIGLKYTIAYSRSAIRDRPDCSSFVTWLHDEMSASFNATQMLA
jgi:DNA-binding transcriptional LysR family regulator